MIRRAGLTGWWWVPGLAAWARRPGPPVSRAARALTFAFARKIERRKVIKKGVGAGGKEWLRLKAATVVDRVLLT